MRRHRNEHTIHQGFKGAANGHVPKHAPSTGHVLTNLEKALALFRAHEPHNSAETDLSYNHR